MRPIHNALEIIEALSAAQPAGVTEIAGLVNLPRSTAQRVLTSLHETGWIEYADERRRDWQLSLRALLVSGRATLGQHGLRNIAIPVMEEVRRHTEETVHLMVRQESHVVLIERLDGLLRVDHFRPLGSDGIMTTLATGRAILAQMDEAEADAIIAANAKEAGLTDAQVDESRMRISQARASTFAITLGGNRADVGAVGAAIMGPDRRPIAALSASGPIARMDKVRCDRFGPILADAAHRISMGLRWGR